jgi:hypothetical protein
VGANENECESLWLFVLSCGGVSARGGKVDGKWWWDRLVTTIFRPHRHCGTAWAAMSVNRCGCLFYLAGVFLLEVGRWISMGSNEYESLWLFVLSCGGVSARGGKVDGKW